MRGRHGIASQGIDRRSRVGINRASMRKNASCEIAVEPSIATALRRPRMAFSAVSRPWRTGIPNSSSSVGNREKSSVIGALADRRVACATSSITGHSTLCSGLSVLALPHHCAPMLPAVSPFSSRGDVNGTTGCDQCQKLRLLTLCRSVVVIAAEPEETRDGAVADPVEEHQAPAKSRRRNAQGCKGMPSIVLAISERALTVLPGFPPMDRREAHEEGTLGKRRAELAPRLCVEDRPPFERVLLGCVVVHGGRLAEPLDRR